MGRFNFPVTIVILLSFSCMCLVASAQLKRDFYAATCPNVEDIVRDTVIQKIKQTFFTIPATLRLFFHDCFVQGCDASVMIQSTPTNRAEKDHPENLSLAGDGFDTVMKARAAVDAVAGCKNKVSCADILAIATRDVIALSGGPSYVVELGRFDGLSSTAASVEGRLPKPTFNLNQLNALFSANGLNQNDMIALSAAHTLGFSHCDQFSNRIFNFSKSNPIDPTLDKKYASQLIDFCKNINPDAVTNLDPTTPIMFDNVYFKNLQQGKGLFTSDQVLFEDQRSKPVVNAWAANSQAFNNAFVTAMTKLGRIGAKNAKNGNIRLSCDAFN